MAMTETPAPATRSEDTRQKILDEAARLFRRLGYRSTTLRAIAREAGMEAGSLYYYFRSKDEILSEVFDLGITRVFDAVKQAVSGVGPEKPWRARVRAAIKAHLDAFFVHGDYTSTNIRIFGQAPPAVQERAMALRGAYENYWKTLLVQAQRAGEIRADADLKILRMFLFGAMNWTMEWFKPGGISLTRLADTYTAYVFDGVDPGRETAAAQPRRKEARRA